MTSTLVDSIAKLALSLALGSLSVNGAPERWDLWKLNTTLAFSGGLWRDRPVLASVCPT